MKVILIIITAIAAAITLPVFNEKHILDFGNTSDIISALCNCVVAGAAVMAFLSAKNWLSEKKSNLAYESVSNLIKTLTKLRYSIDTTLSIISTFKPSSSAKLDVLKIEGFVRTICNSIDDLEIYKMDIIKLGRTLRYDFDLPSRIDFEFILEGITVSLASFEPEQQTSLGNDYSVGVSLKDSVSELIEPLEQYKKLITKINLDNLKYEQYLE
ncbi:TPA: hypothetical protein ACXEV6_004928 [Serratia marcescens]